MRPIRALSILLALVVALPLLLVDVSLVRAQEADQTEEEAESAARRAEVASGLVSEAVANREAIELELAATLSRLNDLAAELSAVSNALTKVDEQIAFADAELIAIEQAIELQAVDAYMNAIGIPAMSFVSSDSVESALVAGVVVEEVVNSGRETVDQLVAKKRELESLQAEQIAKQAQVAQLKSEVDAETDKLVALYEEADTAVALAIEEANAADAAYRSALSAVDAARARDAEEKRQDERTTTTTTGTTGTTAPPTTQPPTTSPPTTTGGGGGGWVFPPAVEQWRSLVASYFPSHRVDEALRIMECESLGDPNAYNPYSGASGLFQFIPSTWAATAPQAGFPGASPFDPVANTASAAWLANRYEELGQYYWQAWSCRRVL